jgi:hypothetical protein
MIEVLRKVDVGVSLAMQETFHVLDIVAFVMLSCFGPVFIPTLVVSLSHVHQS